MADFPQPGSEQISSACISLTCSNLSSDDTNQLWESPTSPLTTVYPKVLIQSSLVVVELSTICLWAFVFIAPLHVFQSRCFGQEPFATTLTEPMTQVIPSTSASLDRTCLHSLPTFGKIHFAVEWFRPHVTPAAKYFVIGDIYKSLITSVRAAFGDSINLVRHI